MSTSRRRTCSAAATTRRATSSSDSLADRDTTSTPGLLSRQVTQPASLPTLHGARSANASAASRSVQTAVTMSRVSWTSTASGLW